MVDVSQVITRALPALGAYSSVNLLYWSEADLYEYANRALKRLAKMFGCFTERDATILVSSGDPDYNLPTRHVSTLHVSLGGALLRPATVRDLEARSDTWLVDSGAVERYVEDWQGTHQIRLYRIPTASGTLAIVFHQFVTDVSAGGPQIAAAPDVLGDWLNWAIVEGAREKESDAAMPEVVSACREWRALIEEVFLTYWGEAQ